MINKRHIAFVLLLITSISCVSEMGEEVVDIMTLPNEVPLDLMTRSGADIPRSYQKLPNPYSLKVMQKIYDDYSVEPVILEPTELYVCFKPQDTTQLRTLHEVPDLELFEYPLDIVLEEGEEYVNSELGENDLPWLYTTVKPDFQFPEEVVCEVLDTCYIPFDGETIARTRAADVDVETIAFGRMGYDVDTLLTKVPGTSTKPSGVVQVDKDTTGLLVPLKGAKVRCHNIVKWATAYTDDEGRYFIDKSFKTKVNYAVVFENIKGFDIWGNRWLTGSATYNVGKKDNSGCEINVSQSCKAWEWAVVNNCAYDYYESCNSIGIPVPPPDLKIWVMKNNADSSAPMLSRIRKYIGYNTQSDILNFLVNIGYGNTLSTLLFAFGCLSPDITIGTEDPNNSAESKNYYEIYEDVHHELAHSSHFRQVGDRYWADYISYIMTYGAYGDGTGHNAELCAIGEMWGYAIGHIHQYEFQNKMLVVGQFPKKPVDDWIYPHVFWDLYASKTLTKKQIFQCLTSTVDTYAELINRMTSYYPSKSEAIKLAFARYGIATGTFEILDCPSVEDIELNKFFMIEWAYSIDNELKDIDFSFVKEKYFENPADTSYIDVIKEFNKCSASISIKKPGYYIIEAKVKGTNLKKYFQVAKHYKQDFSLPGSEKGKGKEPLAKTLGTQVGGPYYHSVTFGSSSRLPSRVVALVTVNYEQSISNFDFRRIDFRNVYAQTDTLKVLPGASTVALPPLYSYRLEELIYDPVDTPIEFNPEYIPFITESKGYYTMDYPEDVCYWSGTDY